MTEVAIIDYKMGNLFSVQRACENTGLTSKITNDINTIRNSKALILPGVGSFAEAMKNMNNLGLVEVINDEIKKGKPFMGICLGFQLLYSESEEFGTTKGLDVLKGTVKKFPASTIEVKKLRVPQIGWNQIYQARNGIDWEKTFLKGIHPNEYMYFVHSFYVNPYNNDFTLTMTNYNGFEYCSSVKKDNIFATQFHPEKSAQVGLKIYSNFAEHIKNS